VETVKLTVSGMTCQGCVRSVKRVLEDIPGVVAADVSLEHGEARVDFDPTRASPMQLKAAVEEAGYDAA
jgi:copper chaperone